MRDYLLAQPDKVLLTYGEQNGDLATRKTLVFALHDHIVQRLASDFRAAGKQVVTLTGKTRYPRAAMDRFQNDPDY